MRLFYSTSVAKMVACSYITLKRPLSMSTAKVSCGGRNSQVDDVSITFPNPPQHLLHTWLSPLLRCSRAREKTIARMKTAPASADILYCETEVEMVKMPRLPHPIGQSSCSMWTFIGLGKRCYVVSRVERTPKLNEVIIYLTLSIDGLNKG
jgi:hypothetical protein